MNTNQTRVVVDCPDCGNVRVPSQEVTMRSCTDEAGWTYRVRCPACRMRFVAPAPGAVALQVIAAGSMVEYWDAPAERVEFPDAPPFTEVDAAMLAALLDGSAWPAMLARRFRAET